MPARQCAPAIKNDVCDDGARQHRAQRSGFRPEHTLGLGFEMNPHTVAPSHRPRDAHPRVLVGVGQCGNGRERIRDHLE